MNYNRIFTKLLNEFIFSLTRKFGTFSTVSFITLKMYVIV